METPMAERKTATPDGYGAVIPYLRVRGAAAALEYYKKAFGAKQRRVLRMGDRIGHAEIDIGGSIIMLSDEFPEMGIAGPTTLNGTTVSLLVYVANVDKAMAKAVAAGGTITRPAKDEFYGERTGQIEDPFGHVWMIQTRIEEVSTRVMQKRLDKMMAGEASQPEKLSK
jgi:PhnB protein